MKISKIEVQKRNKGRLSIFIDGDFRFGLDKELLIKYGLKEGDEITDELIDGILLEDQKQRIKNRAFKILNFRDRSLKELKNRLQKIGYDETLVNEVINGFVADGTLNDERFAKEFVADYTNLRQKGNAFIRNELRKKGIQKDLIESIVTNRDERKIAEDLLKKKFSIDDIKNPRERKKIIQRLLSHGFCYDTISQVIEELIRA